MHIVYPSGTCTVDLKGDFVCEQNVILRHQRNKSNCGRLRGSIIVIFGPLVCLQCSACQCKSGIHVDDKRDATLRAMCKRLPMVVFTLYYFWSIFYYGLHIRLDLCCKI